MRLKTALLSGSSVHSARSIESVPHVVWSRDTYRSAFYAGVLTAISLVVSFSEDAEVSVLTAAQVLDELGQFGDGERNLQRAAAPLRAVLDQ